MFSGICSFSIGYVSAIIKLHSLKLFEYLKRNNTIDDGMYNYCINKYINKIELEKRKIDDDYIKSIDNYKILI